MHSHDRTYLASLGFSDPDKGNRLHDYACMYLATPEIHEKIAKMISSERRNELYSNPEYNGPRDGSWSIEVGDYFVEFPIVKTSGWRLDTRTDIGSMDTMLLHRVECSHGGSDSIPHENHIVCLEVKIGRVSANQIIRQLNFYRNNMSIPWDEFFDSGRMVRKIKTITTWVVVTLWTMPEAEESLLEHEGIVHIVLGDNFNEYVKQMDSLRSDANKHAEPAYRL